MLLALMATQLVKYDWSLMGREDFARIEALKVYLAAVVVDHPQLDKFVEGGE